MRQWPGRGDGGDGDNRSLVRTVHYCGILLAEARIGAYRKRQLLLQRRLGGYQRGFTAVADASCRRTLLPYVILPSSNDRQQWCCFAGGWRHAAHTVMGVRSLRLARLRRGARRNAPIIKRVLGRNIPGAKWK